MEILQFFILNLFFNFQVKIVASRISLVNYTKPAIKKNIALTMLPVLINLTIKSVIVPTLAIMVRNVRLRLTNANNTNHVKIMHLALIKSTITTVLVSLVILVKIAILR